MKSRPKKIAFVLTSFVVGGVEKSFLDLLTCIDTDLYDITAFLPDDKGTWTPILKSKCNVRYLRNDNFKTVFSSQLKNHQLFEACRSLFFRILARITYRNHFRKSTEYFIRSMPRVKEKYDCVVAYQIINDDCILNSLYRLKAPRKIVWSHSNIHKTEPLYGQWYNKFDKVLCVSRFAQQSFCENFPALKNKTAVIHNMFLPEQIIQKSRESVCFDSPNGWNILVTVARLSAVKGQTLIPRTARLLLDAGHSIRWYLIGDGELRDEILSLIKKEQVEDHVVLLGSKDNPYPYIKACDIYVQTSLVEGWGLTVSEAKTLHKPIVTTDAGVMSEQIHNGINGIIVSENTSEMLAKEIGNLIKNPCLRMRLIQQLQKENLSNTCDLNKLYSILG